MMNGCRRASRALSFYSDDPGVPLRSTPGFMLSPRFAGLRKSFNQLDQHSQNLSDGLIAGVRSRLPLRQREPARIAL
jgi:hypothetical protein